jgi:hypothetical protein
MAPTESVPANAEVGIAQERRGRVESRHLEAKAFCRRKRELNYEERKGLFDIDSLSPIYGDSKIGRVISKLIPRSLLRETDSLPP